MEQACLSPSRYRHAGNRSRLHSLIGDNMLIGIPLLAVGLFCSYRLYQVYKDNGREQEPNVLASMTAAIGGFYGTIGGLALIAISLFR